VFHANPAPRTQPGKAVDRWVSAGLPVQLAITNPSPPYSAIALAA